MRCFKCLREIGNEHIERPRERLPPCYENIVITGYGGKGKYPARGLPQAPSRAVSLHRTADLAACGHAETNRIFGRSCLGCFCEFESERGHPPAYSARHAHKVAAGLYRDETGQQRRTRSQAESFLRPWTRRRANTLRPPFVAIRARKPWRRLRTILLG